MKPKRSFSNLFVLVGSAVCAPVFGIGITQMIYRGWFGLDAIYAAHPTMTLGIAAIACVTPLAVAVAYYVDEL